MAGRVGGRERDSDSVRSDLERHEDHTSVAAKFEESVRLDFGGFAMFDGSLTGHWAEISERASTSVSPSVQGRRSERSYNNASHQNGVWSNPSHTLRRRPQILSA